MRTLLRIGSAASALALATMLNGCAAPLSRAGTAIDPDSPDFALATRALAALEAGDHQSAVDLAERAVEFTPDDSTVRALLGNAYFASGRFASAEAAFRDSLSLAPAQPKVVLKLALVQIAQGKNAEALAVLDSGRRMLNAADFGLAVALAGRPDEAVSLLETVARAPGADARLRQNLALAHALAGNWTLARVVAAQDLPPNLVDSRMEQWMAFAKPLHASDQIAALTGVVPAPADPGQPIRLALHDGGTRAADGQPVAAQPAPIAVAEIPQPMPMPIPVAQAPQSLPIAGTVDSLAPASRAEIADVAPVIAEPAYVPPVVAAVQPKAAQSAPTPAAANRLHAERKEAVIRRESKPRKAGDSGVVVQLGAYSSPERVSVAWNLLTDRHPALRGYSPLRARFDSAEGPVWRLSIQGFDSQSDAIERCEELRSHGGSCFVRSIAGDSPVQFASR